MLRETVIYCHPTKWKCNSNCSFCITKQWFKNLNQYNDFLDPDDISDTLIKHLSFSPFEKIYMTGGGEPTLNKNLDKIASKLLKTKKKIYLMTNRNHNSWNSQNQ